MKTGNIVKCIFVSLILTTITGCQGFAKDETKISQKVVSGGEAREVRDDIEYFRKKIHENPEEMKGVLSEAVKIAISKNPGLAIKMEDYATPKVAEENRYLQGVLQEEKKRTKTLTDSVSRQSGRIDSLNEKLGGLERQLVSQQNENRDLANQMSSLKDENKNLSNQVANLRDEKFKLEFKLKASNNLTPPQSNPSFTKPPPGLVYTPPPAPRPRTTAEYGKVLLRSTWTNETMIMRVTHVASGSTINVRIPPGQDAVVDLLKGNQEFEIFCEEHQRFQKTVEINFIGVSGFTDRAGNKFDGFIKL